MSVRAALTALAPSTNLLDVLDACIGSTGDVDRAAGACAADVEANLPGELYTDPGNGTYGRDDLAGLDGRLLQRYPRQPRQNTGHRVATTPGRRSSI